MVAELPVKKEKYQPGNFHGLLSRRINIYEHE